MSKLDAQLVHLRSMRDVASFEEAAEHPEKAQDAILRAILSTNKNTVFGSEHQFSSTTSHKEYTERVPLQGYEDVEPWVQRLAHGEKNILTVDEPFMFATTSGTTRNPKLIPVTKTSQYDLSRLIRVWLSTMLKDYPDFFNHGILTITSPTVEGYAPNGLPMGSMSGLTRTRTPKLLRKRYVIPLEVNELHDYDIRYFLLTRIALGTQISAIITPNPSTVLRMVAVAQKHEEELLEAIRRGTLGIEQAVLDAMEPEQRALVDTVAASLTPAPERAGFLRSIIRRYGYLSPKGVWPEMAIIGCWLGGSAGIQAQEMRSHFDDNLAVRDLGFRATEATVNIPLANNTAAGALALHTNYYEFIEENEIDKEKPKTLRAHELKTGGTYYLILTTSGGLYRYDINDVVEVQGWYKNAPMIAFLRKGRDMVNITGEKLHLNQVVDAAQEASKSVGFPWRQLQLIPDTEASTYDLLLEPTTPHAPEEKLRAFLESFDSHLAEFNTEYETKRKSKRLHLPRLHEMKSGWAHRRHRRDVMGSGKRDSQHKWPVIQLEWDPDTRAEIERTITENQGASS